MAPCIHVKQIATFGLGSFGALFNAVKEVSWSINPKEHNILTLTNYKKGMYGADRNPTQGQMVITGPQKSE